MLINFIMAEQKDQIQPKLPDYLEESIHKIARKGSHFLWYEVISKKISTDGGSYMGVLYEIDIRGDTKKVYKEINIFAKNIVENLEMPVYSIPGVFEREAWTYNNLFKVFNDLQNDAKVPEAERYKMAYSFEECNPKSIILEHLGKRGFKLYHRMEIMTLQYAEHCIKQLAKFHALSFVIKDKMPDYFLKEVLNKSQPYIFGDSWYAYVKNMANYSINCLENHVKEKVGEKLFERIPVYTKYMTDTSGPCTLCHGDYKLNNVMSKELNGKITEVIPIDFQILHYGSPILDFIYFLFQGTDREFRKNHLSNLKELYYDTMISFLQFFEIDIEKYYPKTEFEKIYTEKLDFGLVVNLFYGPFLYAVEGEAPDVTTEDLSTLAFKVDSRFAERFRGLVDDFIEWGYI